MTHFVERHRIHPLNELRDALELAGLAVRRSESGCQSGDRAVLATHWDIASEPTVLLTTTTFRNYTANPSGGRAEALRKAQLAMIGDPRTAHPVFWAPFVVVGEGGL